MKGQVPKSFQMHVRPVQSSGPHQKFLPNNVCWASLKTLDTIGNCVRPVFSLAVSQHMHKVTNLWKFELNRSSKLRDNNERNNTLVTQRCVLSDAWFRDLKFYIWDLKIKFVEIYFFLGNYVTSEGAVSHNVLYYQQLSVTN